MKKTISFLSLGICLILQSCEEKDVLINFGDKRDVYDTTYTAAVETPQSRNVLIEEFTGASCTNCPAGHDVVKSIIAANTDRIVAIAYHTFNPGTIFKPVNKPNEKSLYDFRDSAATDIGRVIFGGLGSIPIAGIDRITIGTSRLVNRSDWSSESNKRLMVAAPVNMTLTSSYNATDNKVRIKVKVAYTKAVTTKNVITIGVLESKIKDAQEFPSEIQMDYEHNHVFRKCLTPFNGNTVLDSLATKQAGRVYEYNYSFVPDVKWTLDNCYIVAFLSNNESDNKEILQAKEVKLK